MKDTFPTDGASDILATFEDYKADSERGERWLLNIAEDMAEILQAEIDKRKG